MLTVKIFFLFVLSFTERYFYSLAAIICLLAVSSLVSNFTLLLSLIISGTFYTSWILLCVLCVNPKPGVSSQGCIPAANAA